MNTDGAWVIYVHPIHEDGWVSRGRIAQQILMCDSLTYTNIERAIATHKSEFSPGSYLAVGGEGYRYVFHVVEEVAVTTRIEVGR